MSPFGDTCNVISQWHLSTMPYSVCYHIASLLIESETQFRAHRHSLLALRWHSEFTLNMKNVLLLDLKFDPDFVLNPFIASVPTESNEINVKFKSLPEVGFLLAGSHCVLANACTTEDWLFLPISSHQVLPSILSFPVWIPAIFLESTLSFSVIGIAFCKHWPLFWITKHNHLKYSVEWERAGSGRSQLVQAAFLLLFLQVLKAIQPWDPEFLTKTS